MKQSNTALVAAAIVKFLETEGKNLSEEKREGLQVAASCIKHSFGLDSATLQSTAVPDLHDLSPRPLASSEGSKASAGSEPPRPASSMKPVSAEAREQAEAFKNAGNAHLAAKRAAEAAEAYTQAIELDPENAVYYSNRAAAFTLQGEYEAALEDCRAAVSLNPEYAKGYGRMGAAYMGLGNPDAAIEAYERAVKLDPDNVGYQSAIDQAKRAKTQREKDRAKEKDQYKERERSQASSASNAGGGPRGSTSSPLGGMDLGALLNNPEIMRMASQMMSNPDAMRNLMNSPQLAAMMQGMMGRGSPAAGPPPAEQEGEDKSK